MSDNNAPNLGVTLKQIERGIAQMGATFARMAEALTVATRKFGRAVLGYRTPDPRIRHGAWNFTGDGLWQSDLCAAWVHDACGLPGSCDCTCHGGALR